MRIFISTVLVFAICSLFSVYAQSGGSSEADVKEALAIITRNLEISENLKIRSAGSEGDMMKAYRLLRQASDANPSNLDLRYASICALRLAAQFGSSYKELEIFGKQHPDFALARLTLDGWKEDIEGIAPAMFRYPECTPTMTEMPPFYARFVKTMVLLPARDGIYPRAVLFLRDKEAYWTKGMLKDAKVETAVVHESDNPQLAVIYARTLLPGKEPDLQEAPNVLSSPKADSHIAAWSYLCHQDFLDFVVIDNQNEIILNQRIKLSDQTKAALSNVKKFLLTTQGRRLSNQELVRIVRNFQNKYSLDDIERKFFPAK